MQAITSTTAGKVALVTGGARRIGATIARVLHTEGMTVVVHYSRSSEDAERLCNELNGVRRNSAYSVQGDLLALGRIPHLVESSLNAAGRLDVLINNASSFYPTPIGSVTETVWNDLMGTNCKAPLFLAQAVAPHLAAHEGCIVNITDAYAAKPLKNHPVYCAAKAGLAMITRVLAHDLAPRVRVNAVAPGAILWPEHGVSEKAKKAIIARTALQRQGAPIDVAQAVLYLIRDAKYMTGATIAVDGGTS